MRQLFSIRFVAALAALAGLALFVNTVVADNDDSIEAVLEPVVVERRIDLIEPVFSIERSEDFDVARDGVTVGYLDLILDSQRVMRVAPGTPGEIACEQLEGINRCAVFADLLGDAVVWFALVPQAERLTAELPPIVELEGGYAILENGWQIKYPEVIERDCGNIDIPTFRDFLRRFGPDSVTVIDLELQEVGNVRCGAEVVPSTAPTTVPATTVPEAFPDGPPAAPTSAP